MFHVNRHEPAARHDERKQEFQLIIVEKCRKIRIRQ